MSLCTRVNFTFTFTSVGMRTRVLKSKVQGRWVGLDLTDKVETCNHCRPVLNAAINDGHETSETVFTAQGITHRQGILF